MAAAEVRASNRTTSHVKAASWLLSARAVAPATQPVMIWFMRSVLLATSAATQQRPVKPRAEGSRDEAACRNDQLQVKWPCST